MDRLTVIFLAVLIVGVGILAWTYTPKGKQWLKDL